MENNLSCKLVIITMFSNALRMKEHYLNNW